MDTEQWAVKLSTNTL